MMVMIDTFLKFESDYSKFISVYDKTIDLSNSGKKEEAEKMANSTISQLGEQMTEEITNMVAANKASREAYNELMKLVRAYAAKYGTVPKEFNNLQFLTEMTLSNFLG